MSEKILFIAAVFLCAYTASFSAYLLVGQKKIKSMYAAALPALIAAAIYILSGTAFAYVMIVVLIATSFISAFYLTKKNSCESVIAVMFAISFCLSLQIILSVLSLNAIKTLLMACVCLVFPLILWLGKISVFPNDFIMTKEQKAAIFTRQFFFFPGLILLLAWQIFLLSPVIRENVYLMIFTLLFQIVTLLQLKQQIQSFQERIENIIDKQYQSELLNFMQVIRSQRHDFNFHTQTIYGMIENGQFDECKDYVSSMMKTVRSTNDILPLFHPATSALLNTFHEMALQKGLQMEIEIHDNLQFIATSVYETNTILGNLLQNAIDELELHSENESRIIHLLIIKRGQYNVIKVSNQFHLSPEEMERIFMPGFTTKRSHEGLGLANALRLAEKYDGTVYPEFEDRTVHFIAKIPMR